MFFSEVFIMREAVGKQLARVANGEMKEGREKKRHFGERKGFAG